MALDQRFYRAIDDQTGLTTQTVLAVPLVQGNKSIGVMEAINKSAQSFQVVRVNDSSLGLSICYGLVLSLGREITVISEPTAGTTFAVWLPGQLKEHAQ